MPKLIEQKAAAEAQNNANSGRGGSKAPTIAGRNYAAKHQSRQSRIEGFFAQMKDSGFDKQTKDAH